MNNTDITNVLTNIYQNTSTSGYILTDDLFKILFINDFCHKILDGLDLHKFKDSISLFKSLNTQALRLANKNLINCKAQLKINDNIIKKVHSIIINKNIAISLVFFAVGNEDIQSLLINFVPICDVSNKVNLIQIFISRYDNWSAANIFNSYNKQGKLIRIMNKANRPNINLSPRQEEIAFLISLGIGLRQTAQILNITYGSVTSTIRERLCHKFNISPSNTDLLIQKLTDLGYNQLVPQSLCIPKTIILDSQICNKYFTEVYN